MPERRIEDVLVRHPHNPILTAEMWPIGVNAVFNPGAVRLADGTTLLLCRVEDHRGHSQLWAARSADGVGGWMIDPAPTLPQDPKDHPEEVWGVEDPRVTYVPELKEYVVAYVAYSRGGPCVSLARTTDFRSFQRLGVAMPPSDKDAALLPRRFGEYWALLHRPSDPLAAHIWVSYSPDLKHWGSHHIALPARRGGWWDASKVGLCTTPIETPKGWLIIYHGVRVTAAGSLYRLGLALLDLATPERCLLRGDSWFFGPREPYERHGDVDNVVFPCGHTLDADGDGMNVYYGAADTCIALARTRVSSLLALLEATGHPPSMEET